MNNRTNIFFTIVFALIFIYICFWSLLTTLTNNLFIIHAPMISGLILFTLYTITNNYKIIPSKVNIAVLFWLILYFISFINNQDFANGVYTRLWTFSCLIYIMVLLISRKEKWYWSFINVVKFYTSIHVIITLLSFFSPFLYSNLIAPIFADVYIIGQPYMAGLNAHYSANAILISLNVILCFTLCLQSDGISKVNLFKFMIALVALILTSKRGPLVFTCFSLIITYYFYNPSKGTKKIFKIFFTLILIITCIFIISTFIPEMGVVFSRFIGQDDITNGRMRLYSLAISLFKEKPILGIGWGGFQYEAFGLFGANDVSIIYIDTHNTFLQLLSETGLIGLSIFLFFSIYTYILTIKRIKNNELYANKDNDLKTVLAIAISIQTFFLTYCITASPLNIISVLFPYGLACNIFYSIEYREKDIITKKDTFYEMVKNNENF